jgi:hypothetical protein
MATLVKPTTKNSPKIVTGNARNNKPASVYAAPHPESMQTLGRRDGMVESPNRSKLGTGDMSVGQYSQSAGNEQPKTDGIKIRGTGAATKGVMARGPMA